jgi:predicted transcriptional regulator
MTTLQIELSDSQSEALQSLARETGRTAQQLLSEAIQRLLDESDAVDWRSALASLAGVWADRNDLPDIRELRREWERDV